MQRQHDRLWRDSGVEFGFSFATLCSASSFPAYLYPQMAWPQDDVQSWQHSTHHILWDILPCTSSMSPMHACCCFYAVKTNEEDYLLYAVETEEEGC